MMSSAESTEVASLMYSPCLAQRVRRQKDKEVEQPHRHGDALRWSGRPAKLYLQDEVRHCQ